MENTSEIKFSETVVLIDSAFLNFVIRDVKAYFEESLQRPLCKIDLSVLITCLLLDAGLKEGENSIHVLMVYDKLSSRLLSCIPADLVKELDGVAFQSICGECLFSSITSEEMVSRGDLFIELLSIVLNSKDVKKVVIIPFVEEYEEKVIKVLNDSEDKEIFQFRMNEPNIPVKYRWDMLAFPVMHALGIKSDEL